MSNRNKVTQSTQAQTPSISYESTMGEKLYCKGLAELCKPDPAAKCAQQQKEVLKSSCGDEAFIVTERAIELPCISEGLKSPSGDYQGEVLYPVATHVQAQHPNLCKTIVFHACVSITGQHFLLIQKTTTGNSWNLSKHEAIAQGRKGAITLRSNSELNLYEHSSVDVEIKNTLDKAAFDTLCDKAFGGLVIQDPDHDVLKRLLPSSDIWGTA